MLEMVTNSLAGRRAAVAGGILLIAVSAAFTLANWLPETATNKGVTLVYVGAEDCAPCGIWQRNQGTAFRDTPEFRRLAFREVKSPTLFGVLNDENWPAELRIYRQAIHKGTGVPLWLVIADDKIVMQRSGLSQWDEAVILKLKSLLR
jgi:hypothetical protein